MPVVYAISKDNKNRLKDGLLVRWLIYSMDGGHYAQKTESVLRRDSYPLIQSLPEIEKGFAKMYRQMIRDDLKYTTFDETDFEGPASKNPAMLFMYLGLRHYGAVDFSGKDALPIEQIKKNQVHHIFPVEFMLADEEAEKFRKQNGYSRAELKEKINDVANLTFVSLEVNQEIKERPPYDYLPKMTLPNNLESHCIPKDPELWRPRNFDKFCDERRRLLARAMNSYLRNLE